MNRILPTLLFTILPYTFLWAQSPSLESDYDPTGWIQYNQTYYKILVVQDGLYRITTAELNHAGVPTAQIDPTTIRLFHRGIEQAIYIDGEADHEFNSIDFLEFYGRRNDGTSDSLLYRPHKAQPHPYFSLFSDTTAYFLTWQNGSSGKRMMVGTDTTTTGLTPEPYHWADELRLFTDTYPGWAAGLPQTVEYSYYEPGEGYTGPTQSAARPYTLPFYLENPIRTGPAPQIDLLLVGRTFGNHQISCLAGSPATGQRLLDSIRFAGYVSRAMHLCINWFDVASDGQLTLTTTAQADAADAYSVSYVRIRYPQLCVSSGQPMQTFQLVPNAGGRSLLVIKKALATLRFWDISDPLTPQRIIHTTQDIGSARFVVTGTEQSRTILAVSRPQTVLAIRPVTFADWRNRKPTYLIISHESLMKPVSDSSTSNAVRSYASYRASPDGGGHDTLIVTMQQLFDQYSYGERQPLAIRRFAKQMLQQCNGVRPYLLLLGSGRSTPGIRHDPKQATLDLVMTAGFPGSDVAFTAGLLNNQPDVPALPTGRVNANTAQDVLAYLAKVKEYERSNADMNWRKNWLHLSGGQTPDERDLFRRIIESYANQVSSNLLGTQVTTITKTTNAPVESAYLSKLVNDGVGVLTFFGHSGLTATDMSLGFCSDNALGYRNLGKYPLLLLNGCALGNFFYGHPTLATDWVLTPNRGAIAAIAQSHIGYVDALNTYTSTFYNLLTDSTQWNKSLGQLQQETIRRVLAQNPGGRTLANAQQMVLQGDPAIRLSPFNHFDYITNTDSLFAEQPLTDFTASPNPFRDQIIFTFTLMGIQSSATVTITLTDLNGHVVRRLPLSTHLGRNEQVWDGRADSGSPLPAGLYFYTLTMTPATTEFVNKRLTGRLVLLR